VVGPTQRRDLTIHVTGLELACGDWELRLAAPASADKQQPDGANAQLVLVAIDGRDLEPGGCAVANGCLVGTFQAGPETGDQAATLTFIIELPESPSIADYPVALSMSLQAAPADVSSPADESGPKDEGGAPASD
jgi:hypothetical protein